MTGAAPMDAALTVTATCGRHFVPRLRRRLRSALAHVRDAPRSLSVALVGDAVMSRLHRRFLGIDGPTDVLTFPLERDAQGRVLDGEVVVCVPHARRAARLRGIDPGDELLLYALHGVLHLAGYDDTTPRGFRRMHEREDAILRRIGVGAVFHRDRQGTSRTRHRP